MMFNLVLSPSIYLSLVGSMLWSTYYYKHNRKNCFREVDTLFSNNWIKCKNNSVLLKPSSDLIKNSTES